MKIKLEYIWLDGSQPQQLRSKTKIVDDDVVTDVNDVPLWNFDGSSTKQAEGSKSDCILKPVRIYTNNTKTEKYPTIYVFCEV